MSVDFLDAHKGDAMNFYMSAKIWEEQNDAPNTTKFAKPNSPIDVVNQRVLIADEVKYRGSKFNGTFLLSEKCKLTSNFEGWQIVEIYCCWFGLRLKTRGLNFKVNMSSAKIIENYSGLVSSNLS